MGGESDWAGMFSLLDISLRVYSYYMFDLDGSCFELGESVVCPLGLCRADVDIMICGEQSVWGRVVVLGIGIFVCDMLLCMFWVVSDGVQPRIVACQLKSKFV